MTGTICVATTIVTTLEVEQSTIESERPWKNVTITTLALWQKNCFTDIIHLIMSNKTKTTINYLIMYIGFIAILISIIYGICSSGVGYY